LVHVHVGLATRSPTCKSLGGFSIRRRRTTPRNIAEALVAASYQVP
jgi:hypothetical protein